MLDNFTLSAITEFTNSYFKSAEFLLKTYNIPQTEIVCDHLGCLFHNSEEFDAVTNIIKVYSREIKSIELHNRRVKVFELNEPINGLYLLPKIEIFEPKPNADPKTLRYGVEHISFYIPNWENFIKTYKERLPIAKEGSVNTSIFIKTEIINTIEIEFRSDRLGEED